MTWWLTRSAGDVPAGDAWLGPSERAALATLTFEKRRLDWRLGRHTAKSAIEACLGVAPGRLEVLATVSGAPVAHVDGQPAEFALSISHRAGRALAVIAPSGGPVGCDLELIEPRSDAFVAQWLAPSEQAAVRRAARDERAWMANLLWSAKEAWAKARGEGLRLAVQQAQVTLEAPPAGADGWVRFHVDTERGREHGWCRTEHEWVMTVVGGGAGPPHALAATRPRAFYR